MQHPTWGSEAPDKKTGHDITPLIPPEGTTTSSGRHVWFYEGVEQSTVVELVKALHEASLKAQEERVRMEAPKALPVHLHIHSYGGEIFAALAVADAIRSLPVPVHTHIEGGAASAATLFSIVGKHRTIGRHGFVLIHQTSSCFWGKFEELKDEMANSKRLMKALTRMYVKHTRLRPRDLRTILKRDLWFSAKKALKVGLIDEIR